MNTKTVVTDFDSANILIYVSPTEEEKKSLVSKYNIDEHTLNSSLDPDELARLEFEPDHMAMIVKIPKTYSGADRLLFRVSSMGMFLFKDKIIVVVSEDIDLIRGKHFNKVNTLNDVMLKIIFSSIIHFIDHLKTINLLSDEIETKISTSMENHYLMEQFTLGKSLVYYQNAINSNSALIDKLKLNSSKQGFTQDEIELLDDILIENAQCYKQAEIYSNILASLMDAKASLISNNLNMLMKTLNIITIMIMVPTFVVSAFSMNVGMPFEKEPYAFALIMGLALVSVMVFFLFWRWKKW
ncbi:MAG: magnesium transporter CorA family protein [Melioribacteraceae bacterium]|nr:magnesium transporter CorA family protein [Melioribacteraceae bacterium]